MVIVYLADTGDIRFSPVITLFNLLYKKGYSINWHDTFAEECTDPALNSAKLVNPKSMPNDLAKLLRKIGSLVRQ